MENMLRLLADVCRTHPTREKVLLVPSLSAGRQLLQALATRCSGWLNVRLATPALLAMDLVRPLPAGAQLLGRGQALSLINRLLTEQAEADCLVYYRSLLERDPVHLSIILSRSLQELRLAGLQAGQLPLDAFLVREKGVELATLLSGYERHLLQHDLWDDARLLSIALQLAEQRKIHPDALWLIPEQMEFDQLSWQLVDYLSQGARYVLPAEPVEGVPHARQFSFHLVDPGIPASPLTWLSSPEKFSGQPPEIQIERAYGVSNELRAVLRQLEERAIPYDQALLCYTQGDTYIPALSALAAHLNLPVTFDEGIPLSFTGPGRLLHGLLHWVEDDYSGDGLSRVLIGNRLTVAHVPAVALLLRQLQFGRGREQYLAWLEQPEATLPVEDRAVQASLRQLLQLLLGSITVAADGSVQFATFSHGMEQIVAELFQSVDELDQATVEALRGIFAQAAATDERMLSPLAAAQQLRLLTADLKVAASGPRPGYLHAVGYSRAGWEERPYTFVVGLSAALFPGDGQPDPTLLEREREGISPSLLSPADAPLRNLRRMTRFLAGRSGPLWLSYSCYDPADGRTLAPSALLLNAYRLTSGQVDADFSSLLSALPAPGGYIPRLGEGALDQSDWWLETLRRSPEAAESLPTHHPGLAQGLFALAERQGMSISEYDGRLVGLAPQRGVWSVTELEALARCPLAYWLRYLLGLRPAPRKGEDWLDPLQKGSLLHQIYCRYQREAYGPAGQPSYELLQAIAAAELDLVAETLPATSSALQAETMRELQRSLSVFWRVEQEQLQLSTPYAFEVPFGLGADEAASAGVGLVEPVVLTLPSGGRLALRGKIDRIDRVHDHAYQIWDFKTGSSTQYQDQAYVAAGQQLQPILYGLAAEELLRRSGGDPLAVVDLAGYLFPTEKGAGRRVSRASDQRAAGLAAVERLLELWEKGVFHATSETDHCTYCDYGQVCRQPSAALQVKRLLKEQVSELSCWKELQLYV